MAMLLQRRAQSCLDMASALDLKPSEVVSHLEHLKRSHKKQFLTAPARCRDCGFEFKGRTRLNTPGRCPQCKGQRVDGPWFSIDTQK